MILSGAVIAHAEREQLGISIEPFDPDLVNPSSYDLTLGDECCVYVRSEHNAVYPSHDVSSTSLLPRAPDWLDAKQLNPSFRFRMHPDGFRVERGRIFLMHTREVIAPGLEHVAVVDGKSSLGRLGLVVHATAGYVDPGFKGQVTLECAALGEDVVVYPGMRIAQVRFVRMETIPDLRLSYEHCGNYVGEASRGPVPSRSYLQFQREPKTDPAPTLKLCSVCSGSNEPIEAEGSCDNCGGVL